MQVITTLQVDSLDTQPLLYFPADWLANFPANHVGQFRQISTKEMELELVDPKSPARAKRYKIVRHNGGAWVSIPKPWLRDQSAKKGDTIRIEWLGNRARLTLERRR